MGYWLLKTEPGTFAFDDIATNADTCWDGITNPLALRHIRSMTKGDRVFIYHSGKEKAIVGVAQVTSSPYQDPKSGDPKRIVVDLRATNRLAKSVPLAEIKRRREFANFDLVRISRLSVMPVERGVWNVLLRIAGGEVKLKKPA